MSSYELATLYGCDRATITDLLKRRGIEIRKLRLKQFMCSHMGRLIYIRECELCKTWRRREVWKRLRAEMNERSATRRNLMRRRVLQFLQLHPCVDCGERDIRVLQFDHIRPATKEKAVAHMYRTSWPRVEAEIAKCLVRCANCHKKRSDYQRGATYYNLEYVLGAGVNEQNDPKRPQVAKDEIVHSGGMTTERVKAVIGAMEEAQQGALRKAA